MHIQNTGNYSTRAHSAANVIDLQESHCIGQIMHSDGTETPALWKIENGTKIGGPAEDDLVQFVDTGKSSPVDQNLRLPKH